MSEEDISLNTYVIPNNFGDTGRCINGLFRTRNLVEAIILAAPPLVFIMRSETLNIDQKIVTTVFVSGVLFAVGVLGIAGDSLTEYLMNIIRFVRSKRIAKYNPRIKSEATPGYLTKELSELPRDKILRVLGTVAKKINEAEEPVSPDIYDPAYIAYFEDDLGVVEKPDDLKTRKELKAEKKERKRIARARAQGRKDAVKKMKALAKEAQTPYKAYLAAHEEELVAAEDEAEQEYERQKKGDKET